MTLDSLKAQGQHYLDIVAGWLLSPQFYAQVAAIAVAVFIGRLAARSVAGRVPLFSAEPVDGRFLRYRRLAYSCRDLLRPLLVVLALALAVAMCDAALGASWLVRLAQSAGVIYLFNSLIQRFLKHPVINAAARWIGLPVSAIWIFGYFDAVTLWLDGLALSAGNIRISLLAILKAAFFGGTLFWLGRITSNAGQTVIRQQAAVDIQTRELAAKAVEILVFCIVGLLLLNVLGLDLTTLAVFSGALGVGLGFGLQQIASNFISGIIILLERSLKVGDFIELEDGRSGTLKEINMRSSRLATYDGKDIMVPNERFITTRFVNWTQTDPHQRYEVEFSVSYDTDLAVVPPLIEKAVAAHGAVLTAPEAPDVELRGFGDNGVNFAVEFWVAGIDDGPNKFTSDIRFLIWDALKTAGIAMPFPQREIRIVGSNADAIKTSRRKP